jgi:nitrogen fixation/metabolism regulation signal transduction histidine kinase
MRRQYIIDPDFQLKFIVKFCLVVIVATAILAAIVLWFSDNSTTVTIANTKVSVKNTVDFIYPVLFQSFVFALVFSAVAVGFLTMLMTHRVAGPLYRLKRELQRVREGDLTSDFKIRGKDQLGDFAGELREAFAFVRAEIAAARDAMSQAQNAKDDAAVKEVLAQAKTRLDALKV